MQQEAGDEHPEERGRWDGASQPLEWQQERARPAEHPGRVAVSRREHLHLGERSKPASRERLKTSQW